MNPASVCCSGSWTAKPGHFCKTAFADKASVLRKIIGNSRLTAVRRRNSRIILIYILTPDDDRSEQACRFPGRQSNAQSPDQPGAGLPRHSKGLAE